MTTSASVPARRVRRMAAFASTLALAAGLATLAQAQAQVAPPSSPPSASADTATPPGAPGATETAQGAQAPPPGEVAEVVVHAERRQTKLQDTPIAITAVSAQGLEARSARNVADVLTTAPNVALTSGPTGGNDAFFFIRGVGQTDSNPAFDPGVAVYIDDVYLGLLQGASLDTLNIGQVEVSRGPQGTLFGRNTIGGAVNIITQDPGDAYGGRVRFTAGERHRREGLVSVDIPVTPTFRVNLSAFDRSQDGWGRDQTTGQTLGDVHNKGARLKAVWDVNDDLQLRFSADGVTGRGTSVPTVLTAFNPAAGAAGIPGATPLGVPFPDLTPYIAKDPYTSYQSAPPQNDIDNSGASFVARYKHWGLTFKSISSYRTTRQFVQNDFDGSPYTLYDNFFDTRQHQFSEELQISSTLFENRLNWLVGGYYFNEGVHHNNAICLGTNQGAPFAIAPEGPCLRNNEAFKLDVKSYAGFGHADFKVTSRLTLNAGIRYTDDEKEQQYNFFYDNTGGVFSFFGLPPIILPYLVADRSASFSKVTPTVGADYRLTANVFAYASWSQGFKSGGFNGRPTSAANIQPFQPETIDTYETGLKTDWLDRKLRVNLTGFYSKYKDIQLQVLDPVSGFFNEENAGDSEIKGFEAEIVATPITGLTLNGNIGVMDNHFTRIDPLAAPAGVLKGNKLPLTPDFTANASAEYRIPLPVGDLTLRGDYNYRARVYYSVADGAQETQGGFALVDVRAAYGFDHDKYQVALFGKNVFDRRYKSNAEDVLGALGVAFAEYGPPAEWGIELSAKF